MNDARASSIDFYTFGSTKLGRLVPSKGRERQRAIELLFIQASFQGPMFGQRMHLSVFSPETVPYAIRRYEEQASIVDRLVEHLRTGRNYFFGGECSIVDIAFYGWYFASKAAGFEFDQHSSLAAWFERVGSRADVIRGVTTPNPLSMLPPRRQA